MESKQKAGREKQPEMPDGPQTNPNHVFVGCYGGSTVKLSREMLDRFTFILNNPQSEIEQPLKKPEGEIKQSAPKADQPNLSTDIAKQDNNTWSTIVELD